MPVSGAAGYQSPYGVSPTGRRLDDFDAMMGGFDRTMGMLMHQGMAKNMAQGPGGAPGAGGMQGPGGGQNLNQLYSFNMSQMATSMNMPVLGNGMVDLNQFSPTDAPLIALLEKNRLAQAKQAPQGAAPQGANGSQQFGYMANGQFHPVQGGTPQWGYMVNGKFQPAGTSSSSGGNANPYQDNGGQNGNKSANAYQETGGQSSGNKKQEKKKTTA